jgi:hypothetical protein
LIQDYDFTPIYVKAVVMAFSPFMLCFSTLLFWGTVKLVKKSGLSKIEMVNYTTATVIILLFLVHPTLVRLNILMLSCAEIDGTSYLDFYMEDECWTGDHLVIVLAIVIPSLVVWGIGIPVLALYILWKKYHAD